MEDHVKRELGCEEGEEPLGGVHMSLQTHIQEMVVQIRNIFLTQRRHVTGGSREVEGMMWRKK